MKWKSSLMLTGVALVMMMTGIATAEELSWTGCGITKKAFMAELAKAYEAKTGISVKLSGGGATKGIRAVSAGTADMGGTCRHRLKGAGGSIHPEETEAELVQVAWDAIVVIVNPANPVNNMTVTQLKQVFDGGITNWKQLGGADQRIALVTREGKYSGVGHMFRRMVFDDPEHVFKARSLGVKSSGPLEKEVAKIPTAMGVDGVSSAIRSSVKVIALDGIEPSKENVASGKYPLFRPLYIAINKGKASAATRKFIDFALSAEGQAVISAQGTVNLAEGKALQPLWNAKKGKLGL